MFWAIPTWALCHGPWTTPCLVACGAPPWTHALPLPHREHRAGHWPKSFQGVESTSHSESVACQCVFLPCFKATLGWVELHVNAQRTRSHFFSMVGSIILPWKLAFLEVVLLRCGGLTVCSWVEPHQPRANLDRNCEIIVVATDPIPINSPWRQTLKAGKSWASPK